MWKNNQFLVVGLLASAMADNPIFANISIPDPHVRIYNNVAYMFAGRDAYRHTPGGFNMPDWRIYSSINLVDWKLETVISPTETFIGNSTSCWASTAAFANGSYYFYFSDWTQDIGVMRGPSPVGPFIDELKRPMFPAKQYEDKQYDPTVLTDDDGSTYMMFGRNHHDAAENSSYLIAKLAADMQGLGEAPRPVINGDMPGNDKSTLHKYNGIYYLSAGNTYATATNIYGPYTYRGASSDNHEQNPPGLSTQAHGNYWTWNNQWFHIWCEFADGKAAGRWRDSWVTYVHYRANGDMVDDVGFLDTHGSMGVGQYSASWDKIEAEWYTSAQGIEKKEVSPGSVDSAFAVELQDGGHLFFPRVHDMPLVNAVMVFAISDASIGGQISIYANQLHGQLLANCTLPVVEGSMNVTCPVPHVAKGEDGRVDIYLVFSGKGSPLLDWWQLRSDSMII